MLSVAVVRASMLCSPLATAARTSPRPDPAPRAQSADLAPELGLDGVFRGAPGVTGTVDAKAWTLVSNLAAGEPPRFAPAANAASSVTEPWSSLGSNGAGNGALNEGVEALAVSGTNLYVGGAFTNTAGIAMADYVAEWNGSAWSALGSNGSGNGALDTDVFALAISGSNLYVGGASTNTAGIAAADYVAEWNGSAWSALGSNGSGNGAITNNGIAALAVSGSDLYVGGIFINAAGIGYADFVALWVPGSRVVGKPDGRIRLGSGAFVGNNIYNTTGVNQSRTGSAKPGHKVKFGISIQNDGIGAPDNFVVSASGNTVHGYTVTYFRGTTDITAAVVGGTYETQSLAPGATHLITSKIKVNSSAPVGSNVTRLVTISAVGDNNPRDIDAVQFIAKRTK